MRLTFTILFVVTFSVIAFAQEYEILFTKQINGNDHLFVINTNGDKKQITDHPSKDSTPLMSPNGDKIVFTSERVGWWKIWLLNLTSNRITQLTNSSSAEYAPAWSPDGKQLLFVSGRGSGNSIFRMNADGSSQAVLSNDAKNGTMPYWAGDNRIYFSLKKEGSYQIASVKLDGTSIKMHTNGAGDKLMPSLSRNGETLLFYGNTDGNFEIYTLSISNQKVSRLTDSPLMDIRPRWSDDGKKIVFERGNKSDNQHIYIMNSDGSNVEQLTINDYNYSPSFVLSGTSLFSSKK